MQRRLAVLSMTVLALGVWAAFGFADHKKVDVVRIQSQTEILAPPAVVWTHVTTGKNLVTWCPVWKSAKNSGIRLLKVGDSLEYTDEWGNGGRSIVTYMNRGRELRVAHEPTRGDYMCQAKLVLTPTKKGTQVQMIEQYTDESPQTDQAATADKMEAEITASLATLKKGVERK